MEMWLLRTISGAFLPSLIAIPTVHLRLSLSYLDIGSIVKSVWIGCKQVDDGCGTTIESSQKHIHTWLQHACLPAGAVQATVSHVVKSILSTSFILGFANVVFNLKSRFCKESAWQVSLGVGVWYGE